ncbi:hypothetical protein ABBQ38_001757 [Trebouxia sp. C0009 RCD-2024]
MNTNDQGPTGTGTHHPVQGDPANAQGGYLGKAQGWATRVTGNLQGQAGQIKEKLVGVQGSSGTAAGSGPTGSGYNPTGTGAGYGATNAGVGQHAQGNPPFSDPNTGYNNPNAGYSNDMQSGHHTQPKIGHADGGTHGSTPKPSYTEQAKQYTAKGADILHGQAEYLKGKLVGTQGTGAPAATNTGSEYSQGTGTGQGHMGGHMHRSGDPSLQSAAGGPQAKKSWTESAKQGLATGLTYTQQGLEVVKNKVGGPPGDTPGMTGTTGTNNTGHASTSPAGVQSGYNAGPQPGYNTGAQPGYNAGSQPGYNAGANTKY